jgi:hypothetical protein
MTRGYFGHTPMMRKLEIRRLQVLTAFSFPMLLQVSAHNNEKCISNNPTVTAKGNLDFFDYICLPTKREITNVPPPNRSAKLAFGRITPAQLRSNVMARGREKAGARPMERPVEKKWMVAGIIFLFRLSFSLP